MSSSHDETPADSTPHPDDEARHEPGQHSLSGPPAAGGTSARGGAGRGVPQGEPDDVSTDAEFLRLVSELDDVPGFRDSRPTPALGPNRPGHGTGPRDWPTTPEVEALEEAESHFVPPDPELDLSGDPWRVLGWVLVVLGAVGVLIGLILANLVSAMIAPASGGGMLLGAVILIWRMPRHRDSDSAGDDGAVV